MQLILHNFHRKDAMNDRAHPYTWLMRFKLIKFFCHFWRWQIFAHDIFIIIVPKNLLVLAYWKYSTLESFVLNSKLVVISMLRTYVLYVFLLLHIEWKDLKLTQNL